MFSFLGCPVMIEEVQSEVIADLRPFLDDGCWMFVILAKEANAGVILRRGPAKWWRVTLWDTQLDTFAGGQWFRGRLYPDECDVSPDGKLFVYFAAKFGMAEKDGYKRTWTAVSRPPYLTALAMWPKGGAWDRSAVFIDNRTVRIGDGAPLPHHPDHPPGPLLVVHHDLSEQTSLRPSPSYDHGWQVVPEPDDSSRCSKWRKPSGSFILGCVGPTDSAGPLARIYTIFHCNGEPVTTFEAHWADWDQRGRLVAAVGGRILVGKITRTTLVWRQLADLHEEKPERLEAPDWAQWW
jgi:hypothetical protein